MSDLAILGGTPVLKEPFTKYRSMGEEEARAVADVVRSGTLSGFYGSWSDEFWGGERVKAFETMVVDQYG